MAYTRSMRKRSLSKRRSYARRVRKSPCRGKGPAACRGRAGCKYTKGKKRSFCRKSRNHKRGMRGGTTHYNGKSTMNPNTPLNQAIDAE